MSADWTDERIELLREAFSYDTNIGQLIWRRPPAHSRAKVGDVAGCVLANGYRQIMFQKKKHLAHRLIWIHIYGRWPIHFLDHVNGNPDDNRLDNLRECSTAENNRNRRPRLGRLKGASYHRQSGRWQSHIRGRWLGHFNSAEEAHAAYCAAAHAQFGEFARES